MDILRIIILVCAILLLLGGVGGHYGLWGAGPVYSSYYGPGIGLGGVLLIIVLIWFFL
jgi:hypothetical protein